MIRGQRSIQESKYINTHSQINFLHHHQNYNSQPISPHWPTTNMTDQTHDTEEDVCPICQDTLSNQGEQVTKLTCTPQNQSTNSTQAAWQTGILPPLQACSSNCPACRVRIDRSAHPKLFEGKWIPTGEDESEATALQQERAGTLMEWFRGLLRRRDVAMAGVTAATGFSNLHWGYC